MRGQRKVWLAYLILVVTSGLATFIALPEFLGEVHLAIVFGSAILVNLLYVAGRLMARVCRVLPVPWFIRWVPQAWSLSIRSPTLWVALACQPIPNTTTWS
jgi:hypothetical protein